MTHIPEARDGDVAARLDFLSQAPIWEALPQAARQTFADELEPQEHAAGEPIIRQGEAGRHLYVIVSGQVEVRIWMQGQGASPVAQLGRGETFGEMALLSADPVSADVVAQMPTHTLRLGRDAFQLLVARNPVLLREFVLVVSRRLAVTAMRTAEMRHREEGKTRFLQQELATKYSTIVGNPASVRKLERVIETHASLEAPLLISGERGVGKELVARQTHFRGRLRHGPLLATECAQIVETPWGDKLFGMHSRPTRSSSLEETVCYMDLAQGGTILLREVDRLPLPIQERLAAFLLETGRSAFVPSLPDGAPGDFVRDARVVATCREPPAELAEAGLLAPDLLAAFEEMGAILEIPPLRERKKDIPALAEHFRARHAERLAKRVERIDAEALQELVAHEYRVANIAELEDAVERAVHLTVSDTIGSEHVFVGALPEAPPAEFDLLRLPAPLVAGGLALFPFVPKAIGVVAFCSLLVLCFAPAPGVDPSLATTLSWSVGWPALALSFLLLGRVFCGMCPMAFFGDAAQRLVNLKRAVPGWLKRHDSTLTMLGVFLIVWAEAVTDMRRSPVLTGVLLLAITAGAVALSVVFRRRVWCRHLCPLGSIGGLCATTALLEVRPTVDVCNTQCKGHKCYTGSDSVPGCPLFNHVMFMEANRHCVLCMSCVKSCPHGSPQLSLSPPGRALWSGWRASPRTSRFIAMVLGLLAGMSLLHALERSTGYPHELIEAHRILVGTVVLAGAAGLAMGALALATRRASGSGSPAWTRVTAWLPLVGAMFACYELEFVPGIDEASLSWAYQPFEGWPELAGSAKLLSVIQGPMLLLGVCVGAVALRRTSADGATLGRVRRRLGTRWLDLIAMSAYVGVCGFLLS